METSIITIKQLVSEAQCYETIRQLRRAEGVTCPHCDSGETIRRGYDSPQRLCQHYQCKACGKRFDDLTGTVLSGHHQPLSVWVLCLYFMGLNLYPLGHKSNRQIAQELDLNKDDLVYDGTPAHGHR
ncbi:MAG: transposase [Methylovulum sp.]|uniref:PaaD-like zinc ribbon domain-containing protein n=1 Tax=Methylovulum sp. TaxID=1916980 RepID=UPI002602182C|nr:transposase [Methylovulum sp.]MDD2725256.1 transposase [Methylovulum sp.]